MKETNLYQQLTEENLRLKRDLADEKEPCHFNPIGLLIPAIGIVIGIIIQFI